MQRRVTLTKLLSFIDESSTKILEFCDNLKTEVHSNGLFIDDLVRVFPNVPKENILKEIDDKLTGYVALPTLIKKELDPFVASLDDGTVEEDESNTFAYMREVWLGDVYGVRGIDALKELAKELRTKAETEFNEETIIETLAVSIELKK